LKKYQNAWRQKAGIGQEKECAESGERNRERKVAASGETPLDVMDPQ
jgi:hypothetical protein